MQIQSTAIPDVKLVIPKRFGDARGFFVETWRDAWLDGIGLDGRFVQDNHSLSAPAGTVRGLHFQTPPMGQAKLVRVVRGRIMDVAVDIRVGSPTFGQNVTVELSAENGHMLFVPVGFAHGFATLEPDTEVLYKVSNYYSAANDGGILWNDPALGIDWGIDPATATLSDKDTRHPTLAQFADNPFVYGG